MSRNFKALLFVLIAIIIAGATYAFAAANTVPDSAVGYKANTVTGFTVTDIVYDLNVTNPTLIDKITFKVGPTSGTLDALVVYVQVATSGDDNYWKSCTLGEAVSHVKPVTCTYTSPTLDVLDVTALNIVASSTLDPAP